MSKVEKSVFISYRRTNVGFALAVYQNLAQHGYDIFFDFASIDSGAFRQVIIENIQSRAHFILVLTPSALDRIHEPDDWLKMEIETAINSKRNIIPLTFEGFDWKTAREKYLTGKLALLTQYNELRVPIDYFMEAMTRLRERFLNVTLDTVLHPLSAEAEQAATAQRKQSDAQPQVSEAALSAIAWFEKGVKKAQQGNYAEAIKDLQEAIHLNPNYVQAHYFSGELKAILQDYSGAIADIAEVLRLHPRFVDGHLDFGELKATIHDYEGAFRAYQEVVRLEPKYVVGYARLGTMLFALERYDDALETFKKALELKADYLVAIAGLALGLHQKGEFEQAIQKWKLLIVRNENFYNADWVARELKLPDAMREEAQKLVAKL